MVMMLKPNCNLRSGCGYGLLEQKTRMSRTMIKVIMAVFFDLKGIVHHEVCTTWSDCKQTVAPGNFSACEGWCKKEDT